MEPGFGLRKYCGGKVYSEEVRLSESYSLQFSFTGTNSAPQIFTVIIAHFFDPIALSRNDRRNPVRKKVFRLALCALLSVLSFPAHAQQPTKIPRIGYLENSTASSSAVLLDAFRQELRKLGWIEGRISPSSIGLVSKSLNGYLSLRRTWFVLRLI